MSVIRLGTSLRRPGHAEQIALDPLIKEARDRQQRRRRWLFVLFALVAAAAVASYGAFRPGGGGGGGGPVHAPVVSAQGIGEVSLGTQQSRAVAELSRIFGPPTRAFTNGGCGTRYVEVEWGQLYVEFRQGHLSGFRDMIGTWVPSGVYANSAAKPSGPKLVTAKGISLGSALGQLRAAYGRLNLIGTDRWQTRDALVFYDNAGHDPPATSKIIEIKYDTCGDF